MINCQRQSRLQVLNILLLDKCKTLLGVSLRETWIWCSKALNGLLSIIITYSLLNLKSLIEQEIYNDTDISHIESNNFYMLRVSPQVYCLHICKLHLHHIVCNKRILIFSVLILICPYLHSHSRHWCCIFHIFSGS